MKISRNQAFTLIELLVVIAIIALLASIAIPVFGQAQEKAQRTKCLAQAKGIYPALKLFAGDHDSTFPARQNEDDSNPGGEAKDANTAYANLIPTYLSNESPFGNSASAWCKATSGGKNGPDNDISSANKILEQGENTYAYVAGMTEYSNASWPIIADAFVEGSTSDPAYSTVQAKKGGVWKGKLAIVVRNDGSANAEKIDQKTTKLLRKGGGNKNLFAVDDNEKDPWLVGCKVLNPK